MIYGCHEPSISVVYCMLWDGTNYGFHTMPEFTDMVTLPQHCPLSFDRMKGTKHLVFMVDKCLKIV